MKNNFSGKRKSNKPALKKKGALHCQGSYFDNRPGGSVDIKLDTVHGFKVIQLAGSVEQLKDSISLKSLVNSLIEERSSKIAISLKEVEYIDSAALNVFIYAKSQTEKSSGHFCLVEPNDYVRDVITVVGLADVFTIHDSIDGLKEDA